MNPLLEQFLAEAREFLQAIGEKLIELERTPDDAALVNELFRFVHTLKGNSGLFEFPEMTRVLHAGEDLMDLVRNGKMEYSQELADRLLDAMDFVGLLCDEIELEGVIKATHASDSAKLAQSLRELITVEASSADNAAGEMAVATLQVYELPSPALLVDIPETVRGEAVRAGRPLFWIRYSPISECFFQGDDPFYTSRRTPGLLWGAALPRSAWPPTPELNAYDCALDFCVLSNASQEELVEHYRYVPDQIQLCPLDPLLLILPQGNPNGGPVYEDFVTEALQLLEADDFEGLNQAAQTMIELSNSELWFASALRWLVVLLESKRKNPTAMCALILSLRTLEAPHWAEMESDSSVLEEGMEAQAIPSSNVMEIKTNKTLTATAFAELSEEEIEALEAILADQRQILSLEDRPNWVAGRWTAVAGTLINCFSASGNIEAKAEIEAALAQSIAIMDTGPLLQWLDASQGIASKLELQELAQDAGVDVEIEGDAASSAADEALYAAMLEDSEVDAVALNGAEIATTAPAAMKPEETQKFGKRTDDTIAAPKSLKVDQVKIDRLMNLIGEIVVSKNALPYLAQRAEDQFGVRELSREIKAQYAVINRIAEEMQDAIMQVRMMPVSFVFQRFPRLVRDLSRKLGKEVDLVLEGEDTEADKNIIESLADPLIHIVRNSLDHGLETPDVRKAAKKPGMGTLTIRAAQEADQVIIEIKDDGRGIDPAVIKRKAYEKGIIDEATLERITDAQAVNLIFTAGFSTAETVSDLSGRGVGMDVVRSAVEAVNGTISLDSEVGKGTRIRISLPLSMAVTKVMIVESDKQIFGVPMDHVVETVRVERNSIRAIKNNLTTVLRGRIIPLKNLNTLLEITADQLANEQDELAVLVVRVGAESVGLVVDNFNETIDVIQKPLDGVLGGLSAYSGSALMGNGSVLMVLNVKEIV